MDTSKVHKASIPKRKGEKNISQSLFPTPNFQVIQTQSSSHLCPYLAEALTLPVTLKNCEIFRKPMGGGGGEE
jgi:hypothetical protein